MAFDAPAFESANFELQEIINNSWDGIGIIDKQTKFVYLNDAFSPMLGFKKEELKTQPFLNFVKQEYKTAFLKLLKDNIANSYNTDINLVCIRKDKKSIYLKITVSLMRNKKYFVLNAKDITKEISDDEILNNYVLSFHTDKNGIIKKISHAFCKLSAYNSDELINISFSSLKHKDEKQHLFDDILTELESKNEINRRVHFAKKNGDSFYVDMTMKSIYNKYGDVIGYTSLMFDITTELSLDKQLTIENSKLEIMSDTIKTISHEWRQPLNVISLKAQTLQFDLMDTDSIQVLEDIKMISKELSETIEDFQNIMKLKSDKKACFINDLFTEAIDMFNKQKENSITFTVENNLTQEFELNQKELLSIFSALFMNSNEAFIKNFIENRTIQLRTYLKNNTIHFNIQDNALGIKEEVLPKIFDPYFSTKEQCHGVGLGLYMCKMLIQTHLGGTIEVKNSKGGALFDIALPLD